MITIPVTYRVHHVTFARSHEGQ